MKTLFAWLGVLHLIMDIAVLFFLAYMSREARLDREKADECLRKGYS